MLSSSIRHRVTSATGRAPHEMEGEREGDCWKERERKGGGKKNRVEWHLSPCSSRVPNSTLVRGLLIFPNPETALTLCSAIMACDKIQLFVSYMCVYICLAGSRAVVEQVLSCPGPEHVTAKPEC